MTPTSEALAEDERVIGIVAQEIYDSLPTSHTDSAENYKFLAQRVIAAYHKAVKEQG